MSTRSVDHNLQRGADVQLPNALQITGESIRDAVIEVVR